VQVVGVSAGEQPDSWSYLKSSTLPDASINTSVAACMSGRWTLEVRPCRDAGPDVQGDAALDGD
jgi:hypothetical protein